MRMIKCIGCGEEKPFFAKERCKKCYCRITSKHYHDNHKKESKQYYIIHKEKLKEQCKTISKKNYEINFKKKLLYSKQRYENNKNFLLQYSKQYYNIHKEKLLQHSKQYVRTSKGRFVNSLSVNRRRYKLKHVVHNFIPEQWLAKVELTKGVCPICFEYFISKHPRKYLTMDHEPPLSKAKEGYVYNIDDVTPVCKSCNSSKNATLMRINFQEFLEKLKIGEPVYM